MIKIGIRHNLIYPLILLIFSSLREILSILLKEKIKFDESLLLEYIMFLSEFTTGLIMYLYYLIINKTKKAIKKKELMGIKLIIEVPKMKYPDSKIKIFFLIFVEGFLDFISFSMHIYYIPKINSELFNFLKIPLISILLTSYSSFFCIHLLKFEIQKHQKYSLYIILLCLIIIVISDSCFIFISKNINAHYWVSVIVSIFLNYLFRSLIDVIDKYLFEYIFLNPFLLIMIEGIIGLLLSSFHLLIKNPFKGIKKFYDNNNETKFSLLIIAFILYFIFSGGKNLYVRLTNNLYSPMAWILTDSIIEPFIFTYNFYFSDERLSERNVLCFIINITISIIIVFCACVYNELFVLYFCDLHINTHYEISRRANETIDSLDYRLDEDNNTI